MGKKFITVLMYDADAGANFFNHTSIMFSAYQGAGQAIEAVKSYGFYGSPLSGNSFNTQFWQKFKLRVDLFSGNQGEFIEEDLRSLTQGGGLREFTIEVSEESWYKGISLCQQKIQQEKEARQQYCDELGVDFADWKKHSLKIHKLAEQKDDQRLKPFVIKFDWTYGRCFEYKSNAPWIDLFWEVVRQFINIQQSHTCKTYARELLDEIGIPKHLLDGMTANGKWPALPRYGGAYQPAYFFAEGDLIKYTSPRTGKSSYYYDRKNGAKLYWTLPPQNLFCFDKQFVQQFSIPAEFISEIRLLMSTLQKLGNLIANQGEEYHYANLIRDVHSALQYFSKVPVGNSGDVYSEYIYNVRAMLIEIEMAASGVSYAYKYDVDILSGLDASVLSQLKKIVEPALKEPKQHCDSLNKISIDAGKKLKSISQIIQSENSNHIHSASLKRIGKAIVNYKCIAKDLSRWSEARELTSENILNDIYWAMSDYMYSPKVDVRSLSQLSDRSKQAISDVLGWSYQAEEYHRQEQAALMSF